MSANNQLKKVLTIKNDKGHSAPAMCAWQKCSGNYLALRFEGVHVIFIYDRQGKLFKKIPIATNCIGLEWDADGDVLAIMIETPGTVVLWEAHSSKMMELDTGLRELSSVGAWSCIGKILALGTVKGNIMVYDHRTLRKIPVVGSHNKKIICAKWSKDEIIAFGTLEEQISLNTKTGDVLRYLQLRGRPSDLEFGCIKEDQSSSVTVDNAISCIVGERTLFLMKYDDPSISSPMELGFQSRYGNILSHFWHGDGYIVVIFVGGFIVLLSSHYKEIGTELVLCELKEDIVRHAELNPHRGWVSVCCGVSTLQIHEASEPKTTLGITEVADDEGRVRQIVKSQWTDDGQLLSVTTSVGDVMIYLTSVPMMGGANFNQLAAMSSLTDCTLYSFMSTTGQPSNEFVYAFQAQPNLVVLGPIFLAAIIHSSAYLYNTRKEISPYNNTPAHKKEFNSNISEFVLNHTYCAARCGTTAHLHRIEGNGTEKTDVKTFPETNARGFKITSMAMAKEIFLYGGENGAIKMFHLDQFTEIMTIDLPTQAPLKGIFTDLSGGQTVLVDKHNAGFYFDILRPNDNESLCKPLPNFPNRVDGVHFDMDLNSRHIFFLYTNNSCRLHLYSGWKDAARGSDIEFVGSFEPFKHNPEYRPICFKKGVVCALTSTGRIERSKSLYQQQLLQIDDPPGLGVASTSGGQGSDLFQRLNIIKGLVNLRLFNEAYELCCVNSERSDSSTNWEYLAEAALEFGQLEIAGKAQARLGNVGMVISIRRMMDEAEDLNALQGEVAMMKGDFDLAEAKYLEAGLRDKALELRRDLQEWDKAMEMADKFNSPLISEIAREYAAVFEYNQDYSSALALYQKAKRKFVGGRILSMKHAMNQIITRSMAPGGGMDVRDRGAPTFSRGTSAGGSGGGDNDGALKSASNQRSPLPTASNSGSNLTSRDLEILLDIDKGLARNMLRNGMESEAMDLITSIASRDTSFVKECARILEAEKKYEKAAKLYLESSEEAKAATCYIKLKQYSKAEEILKKKPAPEIWRQLAKGKEAEGNIIEAARAYADAYDFENGIRLYLTLGIPEEAATLARISDDPQDAVKVALYYLDKGDLNEALMYLIRSECYHDALANAFKFGKTEYYADFVFNHFKGEYPEGFTPGLGQVASDFEGKKDYFRAGKCYQYLRQYGKSFHLLQKAAHNRVQANEEEVMVSLIHTVVYAEDDDMSRQLVEFLLGENDGAPRDPFYLHYYYVMAEKFVEASKTALIVSRSYQDSGSFLEARNSVFDSMCWLKNSNGKYSKDTIDQFNQTQSYMILRTLLNQKDKNIPARIITRIFDNISRFKKACPGLLLAGVNTCQQANLKQSARQMAFALIRDYKGQLDDKFRPAIEQLVRKTAKVEFVDEPDTSSPCPSCGQGVEDFSLNCKSCKCFIPMCIVTGQHIIKSDLGACLGCNFPFRFGEMKRFQSLVKECPVCTVNWEGNSMKKLNDIRPYLYDNIVVE